MYRRYPDLFPAPRLIQVQAEVIPDARPTLAPRRPEHLPDAPQRSELPAAVVAVDDELTAMAIATRVLAPRR